MLNTIMTNYPILCWLLALNKAWGFSLWKSILWGVICHHCNRVKWVYPTLCWQFTPLYLDRVRFRLEIIEALSNCIRGKPLRPNMIHNCSCQHNAVQFVSIALGKFVYPSQSWHYAQHYHDKLPYLMLTVSCKQGLSIQPMKVHIKRGKLSLLW